MDFVKRYLILLATVLLALGILSGCAEVRLANTQAVSWQITPETQQESGSSVGVDSVFLLTLDGKLDEDQVRSCLQIEPAVEYQLQQQEDSVWKLTPEEELKSGKVYAFQVKDRLGQVQQSFAFQTQAQLEVSSTYPEDGAKYVEPNSGIEITFNRRIQKGAEEHFQIEPAVQGKFEYSGETLVFYPTEEMQDGQIYTVTISQGVQSLGDEQLREDYRFSFRVGDRKDNENALYLYQDKLETFLPNDPLVAVIRSEIKDVQTLDATIYRFDSIEDYIAAVQQHQEQMGETGWYEADTCRLDLGQLKAQQVFSSQLTPYINQNFSWKMYVLLPNNLPQGWYLVDLENADRPQDWVQKFVQIGNVSVYTQAVNGSVLIWLNDAETGQPLVQKTVELRDIRTGKTVQGQTDQQGLVTLETGEMGQSYLTVLEDGKKIHFQEVELREEVEIPVDERYYGVLYTDRTVYRASDTIHFWGNVYPRHESDPMPKTVTANLEGLYRQEVAVDSEGFFTGELPFYSMEKGAYTLWIEDAEGGIYQSEYLQIGNYVKPAYILSVEPEKEYYALDEQLTFLVSAQYFDGTPVRGGRVRAESYYLDIPDEYITLDDEGKGKVTATVIPWEYALSWQGSSADLVVSSADEQNVEVQARCDVDLVTSRYGVSAEPQGQDLVIHAGTLDPQRLFEEVPDGEELFDRCVAPGAVEMTLQLERSWYEDEVIGTYYDPINKETVYNTRYERKTEQLDFRKLTVDGTLVLEDYFPPEEDGVTVTYSIRLDGGYGQQIVVSGSAGQISREWWNTVYNFIPRTDNDDWPPDFVSMGQEIPLGIYRNDIRQENTGRVLYSVVQNEVLTTGIFTEDSYPLVMQEDYLPNFVLVGVYFDGRHLYRMEEYPLWYDYEERRLNIEVETDQEQYRPGDTVQVQLAVTDQEGNPAANARLCVGVVDESVFAIQDQQVDLIGQLYRNVYSPYITAKASYVEYDLSEVDGGGKGGGAGDEMGPMRSEFLDTAVFQQLVCDQQGKASVSFQLPDNVTDWRITAAALCGKKAGDNIGHSVATLPLYLRPLVTDRYIEGDQITVSMDVGGSQVEEAQQVKAKVSLLDLEGNQLAQQELQSPANERMVANFGKQPAGQYQVLFEMESGEYQDRVLLPLEVQKNGLQAKVSQQLSLEELSNLQSLRYPVDVLFFDAERKPYIDALQWLSSQDGKRTEIIAASYKAQVAYSQLFGPEQRWEVPYDQRLELVEGTRILPNAQPDAQLAAKVMVACPDIIEYGAEQLFRESLAQSNHTVDQVVMSYVGLAAMDEPVLVEMQNFLAANQETLTDRQKLWMAVGLAELGDFEGAWQIYRAMEEAFSESDGRLSYQSSNLDDTADTTAAALVLHSILGSDEADQLLSYLLWADQMDQMGRSTVPHLEILAYTVHCGQRLQESEASFSYTCNGEKQEVSLGSLGQKSLRFSYDDFQDISFEPEKGAVYACVNYTTDQLLEQSGENQVSIRKVVTPVEGNNGVGKATRVELIINFEEDAPLGYYTVSDSIPSGMRLMTYQKNEEDYRSVWIENENQQITAQIYRDTPRDETEEEQQKWKERRIVYYISGVLPGEYVVESACLSNPADEIFVSTERQTIMVEP